MKVLIIGGQGMAGHMIRRYLEQNSPNDQIWYTLRGEPKDKKALQLDVMNESEMRSILHSLNPDVVINATGLLNDQANQNVMEAVYVNSLLPHRLAEFGKELVFRFIHISTDCVFSGEKGEYKETDEKDGLTVYAKTKSLGEVEDEKNLTIRTSIVGPELKTNGIGLFHWFMKQKGEIFGYRQVFWNGVTTLELAKAVKWVISKNLYGLVHLAAPKKISKYDLLTLFKEVYDRNSIIIRPLDSMHSDKSLVNTRVDFDYPVPNYKDMVIELKEWMETSNDYYY